MGLGIKHFILAMRLLANMMAGHLVLAVIMAFIAASAASLAWYAVTPASVFGAVALSLLEVVCGFPASLHFHVSCRHCLLAWPSIRISAAAGSRQFPTLSA